MSLCRICENPAIDNAFKLGGHKRFCQNRASHMQNESISLASSLLNHNFETVGDDDHVQDLLQPEFLNDLTSAVDRYLGKQQKYLQKEACDFLQAGFNVMLNAARSEGNIRIYLEIAEYISICHGISGAEADGLLGLIRRVTHIYGMEIPLPQRYSSIQV